MAAVLWATRRATATSSPGHGTECAVSELCGASGLVEDEQRLFARAARRFNAWCIQLVGGSDIDRPQAQSPVTAVNRAQSASRWGRSNVQHACHQPSAPVQPKP